MGGTRGHGGEPAPLGMPGASSRRCWSPVLTVPLPLGDARSSILGDSRARRCAETALDQPFRTGSWRWMRIQGHFGRG